MSGLADHLTILLVEDNPGDRRLAEIALQEASSDAHIRCELQMAGTLAEALSRLGDSQNCFDAVLLERATQLLSPARNSLVICRWDDQPHFDADAAVFHPLDSIVGFSVDDRLSQAFSERVDV